MLVTVPTGQLFIILDVCRFTVTIRWYGKNFVIRLLSLRFIVVVKYNSYSIVVVLLLLWFIIYIMKFVTLLYILIQNLL